ncbi:hypothetical protein [Catenibacterium sp.]
MKTDNTLLDKMLSEENLGLALAQVRRNRGSLWNRWYGSIGFKGLFR